MNFRTNCLNSAFFLASFTVAIKAIILSILFIKVIVQQNKFKHIKNNRVNLNGK